MGSADEQRRRRLGHGPQRPSAAGRRGELAAALAGARAGRGRTVGIVGDPGVGKSRLVRGFAADCRRQGASVHAAAGVAHGRYVPLLPAVALCRDLRGIAELDDPEVARARVQAALGPGFGDDVTLLLDVLGVAGPDQAVAALPPAARRHRLLALVARVLETRAAGRPAVVIVEDVHWLDDASGEFLQALVAAVAGTGTLLVATYRPEHEAAWTRVGPHNAAVARPARPGRRR